MYCPDVPDDPRRTAPPYQAPGEREPGETDRAATERDLDLDLHYALISQRQILRDRGDPLAAAEELYGAASGNSKACDAWAELVSALSRRNTPDAEILTQLRRWHTLAYGQLLSDLLECIEDGQRVSFCKTTK